LTDAGTLESAFVEIAAASPPFSSVLVWRPDEFDNPLKAPGVLTSACCLRTTTAGSRAVVYRTTADQGIAGIYDFLSAAFQHPDMGWAAYGVLHRVDPHLPRADLLADQQVSGVFAHIQGRRSLPDAVARRLRCLLPDPPFATLPEPLPQWVEPASPR
jgi:hypothetical protein